MNAGVRIGQRAPLAMLAELVGGEVKAVSTDTLFAGRRAVVIGVPGAFTPICTKTHLPEFIASADEMRRAGYSLVACIVTSDPFATERWAREMDPEHKVRFLSDGNLDFTRAANVVSLERDLFLGERSARYLMVLENAIVHRFSVERSVLDVSCTRGKDVFLD